MRVIINAVVLVVLAITAVALYTRFLGGSIGRITSWWRTPWHNADVGGRSGSTHILGWAVDLVPGAGESMDDIADAARAAGFPVVVNEGNHVHVSWLQS